MSNSKSIKIGRFPYWADTDSATETEDVGRWFRRHGKVDWNDPFAPADLSDEAVSDTETIGGESRTVVPIPIPPYYYYADHIEAAGDSEVKQFPWEKWSQLPKVEREAEMKEAAKESAAQSSFSRDVQTAADTEAVGHHGGPHSVDPDAVEPDFSQTGESTLKESGMDGLRESGMDGLRDSDPQTAAADSLTGDVLVNADTDGSPSWFHMHHDDGINDGYLDVDYSAFDSITGAQPDDAIHTPNGSIITGLNPDAVVQVNASGFDLFMLQGGSDLIAPIAEPFADAAAITDLVTGKSSPIEAVADPFVAAGPLDAVKVDEPRNNDF